MSSTAQAAKATLYLSKVEGLCLAPSEYMPLPATDDAQLTAGLSTTSVLLAGISAEGALSFALLRACIKSLVAFLPCGSL